MHRFQCLRCTLCRLIPHRVVAEDKTQVIAKVVAHLAHHFFHCGVIHATQLCVFHEGQRSIRVTQNMVTLGVNGTVKARAFGGMAGVVSRSQYQRHHADNCGEYRRRQHTDTCIRLRSFILNGQVNDKQGNGKANTGEHRASIDVAVSQALREFANTQLGGNNACAEHTQILTTDETGDNTPGQRRLKGVLQRLAGDDHTGVGQGEHGHNNQIHDRREGQLHTLVDGNRTQNTDHSGATSGCDWGAAEVMC